MQEELNKQQGATSKKGKILLVSVGVIGLGTLGYFAWHKFKPQADDYPYGSDAMDFNETLPTPKNIPTSQANDSFPLKRGSNGGRVKLIQQVLAKKGLLAATDVIGQFGPKTEAALIKAGLPIVIDESSYSAIINEKATSTPAATLPVPVDADKFAAALYNAALIKSYAPAIALLKMMKTVSDYSAVSEKFKTYLLDGVHQTLVNGMLSSFSSIDQKAEIKKAFTDMGLKYDGSKFSLSGIPSRGIITIQSAFVSDGGKIRIRVPANMVLGTEAGKQGIYTKFKNNGRLFFVPTSNINYL